MNNMNRFKILFWVAVLVYGAYEFLAEADRGDDGSIVGGGDLSAFSLRIGDCFNYEIAEDTEEVAEVGATPCSDPHSYETYGLHIVDSSIETYPGDEELAELAFEQCFYLFEDYVGISYQESILDLTPFYPTAESWSRANDREIACLLFHTEEEKMTRSMRGSGI